MLSAGRPRRLSPIRLSPKPRAIAGDGAEWRRVLRHHRPRGAERRLADADELMHAREPADDGVALDGDVARERGAVREDDGVAEVAVVRDVRRNHEQAAGADARGHAAAFGPRIDRDVFAHDVTVAHREGAGLAAELEVLRHRADARELEHPVARAQRGASVDHRMRPDPAIGADRDVRTHHGIGADAYAVGDVRRGQHRRRRMDARATGGLHRELHLGNDRLVGRDDDAAKLPAAPDVTSRRNASPGITGRRKRARSTLPSTSPSSSPATAAPSCASASHGGRRGRRASREMTDEVRFVRADQLRRHGTHARSHLEDAVDERIREARGRSAAEVCRRADAPSYFLLLCGWLLCSATIWSVMSSDLSA